jgi:hypothetical protein
MSCAAPLLAPPQDLHRPGAGVPPGSRGPQPGHTPPGQYATSGTVPRAIGGTSLASVTRAASLGESEGRVLAQGMTALGLVRLYNPRGPTKASSKPIHFRAPAEPPASGTAVSGVHWRPHRSAVRAMRLADSHGLAMTFHRTVVQSRGRHGYYVGSRRGSTFDIAPDELACIHHDVGVRVNETNGNWECQR